VTTGNVGAVGYPPTVLIQPAAKPNKLRKKISGDTVRKLTGITKEKEKYIKVWKVKGYRKVAPGEDSVPLFLEALEDLESESKDEKLIDFGCGTGRAAMLLDETFDVIPMDIAFNCLDKEAAEHFGDRFIEHDITQKTKLRASWGYCTDVMEHLPPEQIDDALDVIFEACDNIFFQISTGADFFSGHPDIKDQLHLSVFDYGW